MPRRSNRDIQYVEKHWTLDKRIPVVLIVTLFINIASGIWWAGGAAKDIQNLSRAHDQLSQTVSIQSTKLEKINTLDVELRNLKSSVDKLESTLDRAIEKLSPPPRR
jgi:Tfp pilus assembly protein PilO